MIGASFFITFVGPDQTTDERYSTGDLTFRVDLRGTYYITSYGINNGNPADSITCHEPITVNYTPWVEFTGGGTYCTTDSAEPLVAHFSFRSEYFFHYHQNGVERKLESSSAEEYVFPLENILIECDSIFAAGCTTHLSSTAYLQIMDQIKPVISGDERLCEMEWGVYSVDSGDAPLEWAVTGTGMSYIDTNGMEPLMVSARWEDEGPQGIMAHFYYDSLQCYSGWSDTFAVSVISGPEVMDIDTSLCPEEEESLIIDIGELPGESVEWQGSDVSGFLPEFTIPGEYKYIKYEGICSDTGTIVIRNICGSVEFFVPEAFTPNWDQINDYLEIFGNTEEVEYSIYSTGGVLLYTTRESTQPWDGACNGVPVPAGTYHWSAVLPVSEAGRKILSGVVTVIR